jgi:hypothetical protein
MSSLGGGTGRAGFPNTKDPPVRSHIPRDKRGKAESRWRTGRFICGPSGTAAVMVNAGHHHDRPQGHARALSRVRAAGAQEGFGRRQMMHMCIICKVLSAWIQKADIRRGRRHDPVQPLG